MPGKDRTVHIFRKTFTGRVDVYGSGSGKCVRGRLTDAVIMAHLQGKVRLGVYPLMPDGTVHFCALDIDEPDLDGVTAYISSAEELDIPVYLEASKSKGFHLWHFFRPGVEARNARGLVKRILTDAGLDPRLEIFPKQDALADHKSVGNYINLPLFGGDVPRGRTVFLNSEFQPIQDQWGHMARMERVDTELLRGLQEEKPPPPAAVKASYDNMLPCVPRMMQGVSAGRRDVVAFTLAKHFRVNSKFPQEATEAILQTWNMQNSPPLEAHAIMRKVHSAYQGNGGKGYTSLGCQDPLVMEFCQKETCRMFRRAGGDAYFNGNAFVPKRLADALMLEHSFLFCGGMLYLYENGVYRPTGEPFIKRECRERLGEDARTHYVNEAAAHISDMTYTQPDDLNPHKHLINLENGMFDLKTGKLMPHQAEHLSTIRIPVEYNPQALFESSCIASFFADVLPLDCIKLVEEFFGYALIPDSRFGKALMLTGSGANGKSTLLNLLERFIGRENVSKVPLQELDQHRFKRADLFGKLVNMFPDLNSQALKSSTYFKAITTGDVIDAERKNKDPFYFRPFARMIFSANELPSSRDKSFAYYRRWNIVPFPNQFVGKAADTGIMEKLTQAHELSALLNQALIGLQRLLTNQQFSKSDTADNALDVYRNQNDTVGAFLSSKCEFGEDLEIERGEFYAAYSQYCAGMDSAPVSRNEFYNSARADSRIGERKRSGSRYFIGASIGAGRAG